VGVFDAMRISADTAPTWGNHYFGMSFPFLAEPHAPSAENALHNVLTRANFHQCWWWNDPDCILLRPESQLNLTEIQTVASVIALTGGMLLVSDDLERLPEERQTILSQMLPPIQSAGRVLDALTESKPKSILWEGADATGSYALVAMINWENTPKPLTFDPRAFMRSGRQFLSSFWDGQVVDLAADQCTIFINIPAHGTVLLAVRNAIDEVPIQYLGGNLHISQGLELRDMRFDEAGFELQLDLPRTWRGEVRLWVKRCPREMRTEKAVLESWQVINHILRMTVSGEGRAKISGGW
jgi:alpha-galactosidase